MTNLPSGTVTFLFTDIEGSTKRWEHRPQGMRAALSRHDALLRGVIEAHGGYIFKTVGDAFCVAFSTSHDALQAAVGAQGALATEEWPVEIGDLRVRMALHTGVAHLQDGDYFGQPLNRVARLLSAGHGGQMLLSLPTQELVRDSLPAGVTLRDMGDRRLKDLIRPERVFQVVAPDLPSDFPPLKTLDARPNNLPAQATPLIGREKELQAVQSLLRKPEARLVTLTGPGGTGKTRLALQAAADLVDHFADGVFFVNLAPLSDPSLVLPTIAQALEIRETGSTPVIDTLKSYLREREMLLLLDNFEQVVDAAPGLSELLAAAPRLKVLATSRVSLRLKGEKEYPVPTLGLPPIEALRTNVGAPLAAPHIAPPEIEQFSQYEAVRLFIERATDVKPDFEVTNDNAPAVAEICQRLDGLPLAIELAAARIRLLPPQAMLARFVGARHASPLHLLTGGARDLPARHQTLRNTIEWSYDLLTEGEKQLFRRMAVFVGGRTLEALEAVCNAEGDLLVDLLDGVESLVSKSLLRQEEGVGGEPRFVMLETIHEYAREKLEESGEAEALRWEHARYFVELAERAEPHLASHDQIVWMDRLDEEIDNLRAVLDWSDSADRDAESAQVEVGLRLGAALHQFWWVRGYGSELLGKLGGLLAHPLTADLADYRARALMTVGDFTFREGNPEGGWQLCSEAVELAKKSGNRYLLARALFWLGRAASVARPDAAEGLLTQALELSKEVGDRWGISHALWILGNLAPWSDNMREKRRLYTEALTISRETGDQWHTHRLLEMLGSTYQSQGEHEIAEKMYREAFEIIRKLKDKQQTARMLTVLGAIKLLQGKVDEGRALLAEGAALGRETPSRHATLSRLTTASFYASLAGAYDDAESYGDEYLRLSEELGHRYSTANARVNLAPIHIHRGELSKARRLLAEGLTTFVEVDDVDRIGRIFECLVGLGVVAAHEGKKERALRLWGAAAAMEEVPGSLLADTATANQYREALERLKGEIGAEAFQRGWEEGRAMSMEEAVKYALEDTGP